MRNIFVLVVTIIVSLNAYAGEGRVLLDKFLTETQTMSAKFKQTLKSADGKLLQESAGVFYLQRPGRFRWNYTHQLSPQALQRRIFRKRIATDPATPRTTLRAQMN